MTVLRVHSLAQADALTRAHVSSRRVAPRHRWIRVAIAILLAGSALYVGYVGWAGSGMLAEHERTTNCTSPGLLGWQYEAINYDILDDLTLAAIYPDPTRCGDQGRRAGDAVVSSDGIRIAGWYIPSSRADSGTAPTIVLVHGLGANKSEMLRYAATLHDRFNLVIPDLRDAGRSSGTVNTIGALEYRDLQAALDWLEATKHPRAVGVLGDSGGAAAAAKLARTDRRIAALVLDSVHARFADGLADELPNAERLSQLGLPALPFVWAVYAGMWLRTGSTPGDADPIDAIPDLGTRPLMLIYRTADADDVPAQSAFLLYAAARKAGVPVEIHACEGAVQGRVVSACRDEYRSWVVHFFDRVLGTSNRRVNAQ